MEKSTHKVEVVPVHMRKHPNADALSIVDVYGYSVCVRTADWQEGQLGAYIPPDSVVPDQPTFTFLNGHLRIRAKKLRGIVSFGLLIPAPARSKIGDDVAEVLGVTHYEPQISVTGGDVGKPPPGFCGSKYDVDSLRRYSNKFTEGELVMVTEKLHGASARYVYVDGTMYCGSRTEWKREDSKIIWWKALTPEMREFCEKNPGYTIYGEVFGQVQSLNYGAQNGELWFAAFDLAWPDGTWFDAQEGRERLINAGVWVVPLLAGAMGYSFGEVVKLAEGKSLIPGANHVREGCVIKPLKERWDEEIGRVCLKVVGTDYLTS